jgi:hypothetical protein
MPHIERISAVYSLREIRPDGQLLMVSTSENRAPARRQALITDRWP